MSSNHINTGIILVSDNIIDESYLVQNHLIGNYITNDKKEIKDIEDSINAQNNFYLWQSKQELLFVRIISPRKR